MAKNRKLYQNEGLTVLMKNLSLKLKAYREDSGVSQTQLSKQSKVALSTINEIENAVITDVRLSTIASLANSLNRRPVELLTDSDLQLSDPDRNDFKRAVQTLSRIMKKI